MLQDLPSLGGLSRLLQKRGLSVYAMSTKARATDE